MKEKIAVIGGINMDILGTPSGIFSLRDSNIGHVSMQPGGVGRNIAAQAAALNADVTFFTAFGNDAMAQTLMTACQRDGLDIRYAIKTDLPSSVYLAVHDENGDMLVGINDMALSDALTPSALAPLLPQINEAQACVLDANLPEETLAFLAPRITVPILLDPVSCQKAPRVAPILRYLTAIKPNLYEAETLTMEVTPEKAAEALLHQGVKRVFLSLGAEGVYYADADAQGYLRPNFVSTAAQTGAGDAMTAGLTVALCQGLGTKECAEAGMNAAKAKLFGL